MLFRASGTPTDIQCACISNMYT